MGKTKNRFVDIDLDGETYTINMLDFEDPTEDMVRSYSALANGFQPAVFDIARLLGVDTTGWRQSKVLEFFELVKAESELEPGESSGSAKSSEPTQKKSNKPSSRKG